jgi:nucleotide-binding universal stress UspA family protein
LWVDGSIEAKAALRVASRPSEKLGLRLVVAYVTQAGVFATGRRPDPVTAPASEEELHAGEVLLAQIVVDQRVVDPEQRFLYGFPAEGLADLADEEDAELVVVGSRGRGAFKAAFLGNVSTNLIGVARCPVLVVPPGAVDDDAGRPASRQASRARSRMGCSTQ